MKKLVFSIFVLICCLVGHANAQSVPKKIFCTGGPQYRTFSATVGAFMLIEARISNGYAMAELICTDGVDLDGVDCVGHWFGSPNNIVEVRLHKNGNVLLADHKSLTGTNIGAVNWPCTIK